MFVKESDRKGKFSGLAQLHDAIPHILAMKVGITILGCNCLFYVSVYHQNGYEVEIKLLHLVASRHLLIVLNVNVLNKSNHTILAKTCFCSNMPFQQPTGFITQMHFIPSMLKEVKW